MNSRTKGKVGEREFASLLREHGYDARRGQQFAGGADSPDVVSDALAWLHFEIKRVQNLNLTDACVQAERDQTGSGLNAASAAKAKKLAWVVAHRRNHAPWLITMRAEFFFNLIREFDPAVLSPRREDAEFSTPGNTSPQPSPQSGEGEKISEAHVAPLEIQHNNTETPKTKEQQT
jgi:Holliday junction resolvase